MNNSIARKHIQMVLKARKIRPYRFAKITGVDSASLWKFLHREDSNLNTETFFKLWPHIYGNQIPEPILSESSEQKNTVDA